jgi:hypothetical protein
VYLDLKEGIDLQFLGENYNKSRLLIPEKHKRLHQC